MTSRVARNFRINEKGRGSPVRLGPAVSAAPGTYRPNDSSRNRTDHDEPKLISQPVGERKCFFPISSREHDVAGLRKNAGHPGSHQRVIIHNKHRPRARGGGATAHLPFTRGCFRRSGEPCSF
jgi:hypothetical protein